MAPEFKHGDIGFEPRTQLHDVAHALCGAQRLSQLLRREPERRCALDARFVNMTLLPRTPIRDVVLRRSRAGQSGANRCNSD